MIPSQTVLSPTATRLLPGMWSRGIGITLLGLLRVKPVTGQELLSLDGDWDLSNGSAAKGTVDYLCVGAVPGTVPGALFRAGLGPDPTYGRNQLSVRGSVCSHPLCLPRLPSFFSSPLVGALLCGT